MGLNSEFFVNLGLKSKGFEKGLKDAGKDVDKFANTISDYGSVIQEQKDITIEFEKELRRLETALKNTSKGNLAQQKSLKDGITNIKAAIGDQRLALKDLNNQQGKNNVTTKTFSNNLARNYGAIQLLDKVTGGLASELRAVEDATKLFNVSLDGTKKALIATGIGIFIIALGVVVNYWDDIKGAISGADDSLIELNKTASETVTTFNALADAVLTAFEFDGLIDSADGLKNIRKEFKDLDDAIKELEATGQDNEANVSGLINKYREYIVVQEKLKKALDDIQKLDPGQDDFKVQQGKLKDLISSLFTQRNV
jgi:chromosome segregation ATPase